jgi:hypothetical protein
MRDGNMEEQIECAAEDETRDWDMNQSRRWKCGTDSTCLRTDDRRRLVDDDKVTAPEEREKRKALKSKPKTRS